MKKKNIKRGHILLGVTVGLICTVLYSKDLTVGQGLVEHQKDSSEKLVVVEQTAPDIKGEADMKIDDNSKINNTDAQLLDEGSSEETVDENQAIMEVAYRKYVNGLPIESELLPDREKMNLAKAAVVFLESEIVVGTDFQISSVSIDNIRAYAQDVDGHLRHGFMDEDKNIIIDAIYEGSRAYVGMSSASNGFSEGLAPVKLDGKWGYINRENDTIIDFSYEDAGMFSQGLAYVKLNGKYGYIDKKGSFVIQPQYENALDFHHGFGIVGLSEDTQAFIDTKGNLHGTYFGIYTGRYELWAETGIAYIYSKENKYDGAVRAVNGEIEVIIPADKYSKVYYDRNEKYYRCRESFFNEDGEHINTETSYLDEEGKVIQLEMLTNQNRPTEFNEAGYGIIYNESNYEGLITKEKEVLLEASYVMVRPLYKRPDFFVVRHTDNTTNQLYNAKIRSFVGDKYLNITSYNEDFLISTFKGDGLMDSKGKVFVEPYDYFEPREHEKGLIKKKTYFGTDYITDLKGKILSDQVYKDIGDYDDYGYREVSGTEGRQNGLSDIEGKLILPFVFQQVQVSDEDQAMVSIVIDEDSQQPKIKSGIISISENRQVLEPFITRESWNGEE